jgi:hypothetical protein
MSYGAMDFTPLLGVSRSTEWYFLILFGGLLLAITVIDKIPAFRCVDLSIFLLLLL